MKAAGHDGTKVRAVDRTGTLREQLQDETTRQVLALTRDHRFAESAVYEKIMVLSDSWIAKTMDAAGESFYNLCQASPGIKQIPQRLMAWDKVLDAALAEDDKIVSQETKAVIQQYQEWVKNNRNEFVLELNHFSRKPLKSLTPKQHLIKIHFKGNSFKLWERIRNEIFKLKMGEPAVGDEPKQPRERSIERLMKEIGIPRVAKGKGKGNMNVDY